MSTPSSSPSVKRHGAAYTKRIKRMVGLLSTCEGGISVGERARQAHYWLEAMTPEDGRRMRSPAERLNDQRANATPKDSLKV